MRIFKTVGLAFFFFMLVLPFASAHGSPFHSLAELDDHLRRHFTELRTLQNQKPADESKIEETRLEIQAHAKDYQRFSEELITRGEQVQKAKLLNEISGRLYGAAALGEFSRVIEVMGELKNLLKPLV